MLTVRRLWQALIGLALLGWIAAQFGPTERWWGVDIGATGASLFFLGLAGLVTLLAFKPGEIFPESWSLEEKRAWVGTVITGLILVTLAKYLWILAMVEPVPTRIGDLPARNLISFIVVLGIAWGVLARVLGRDAGPVEHDERDLRLRFEADRAGDWTLSLAVVACVVLLASTSATRLEWWLKPLVLANVLIALMFARWLIEYLALILLYARARR